MQEGLPIAQVERGGRRLLHAAHVRHLRQLLLRVCVLLQPVPAGHRQRQGGLSRQAGAQRKPAARQRYIHAQEGEPVQRVHPPAPHDTVGRALRPVRRLRAQARRHAGAAEAVQGTGLPPYPSARRAPGGCKTSAIPTCSRARRTGTASSASSPPTPRWPPRSRRASPPRRSA